MTDTSATVVGRMYYGNTNQAWFFDVEGSPYILIEAGAIRPYNDGTYDIGTSASTYRALYIKDGVTAPGTPSTGAVIYVDTADGDLKVKFSDGFVATLAADS